MVIYIHIIGTGGPVIKTGEQKRKMKKAEAAAQAAVTEHARKYGICSIPINMAQFFACKYYDKYILGFCLN